MVISVSVLMYVVYRANFRSRDTSDEEGNNY